MYIVTGGAGFIGSAFISFLNQQGIRDIAVVDVLEHSSRWKNLRGKEFIHYFHRDEFVSLIERDALPFAATAVIHMGACSSTTETDADFLMRNNYRYSVSVAEFCSRHNLRLIYASSAATYGAGECGYDDAAELKKLAPLNPYGFSKHAFDLWMTHSKFTPRSVGLKFFNVYGPGEYYKGDMSSVVYKSWQQIKSAGNVKLFKSYRPDFGHGEQKRDFVYVKDCCKVMWWLLQNPGVTGLFNVGSGTATSWKDLVTSVFSALNLPPSIEFIEMPESLRAQYQYFTEAKLSNLRAAGYTAPFTSLEMAVRDYVSEHLERGEG